MSLQATAVKSVMGLFSNMLTSSGEPHELREKIHNSCKRMPAPPPEADYEQIRIGGLRAYWVRYKGCNKGKAIMYLHGGGFMFGGTMTTHKDLVWRLSKAAQAPVLSVEYRLAPEHPFPQGLDDCIAAYRWLLDRYDPQSLAIAGDSAGGNLTCASLLRIRDEGLPLPAAGVALSPWTDMLCTGESIKTNLHKDKLIPGEGLKEGVDYYLQGADPSDPYASPYYGDQHGLPPMLFQVGSEEVLLDDSRRLARKMEEARVPVVLDIWEGLPHVWQALSMLIPEGKMAIDRIGIFLRGHMRATEPK
ncbi:MAG: alpha/beta hydrolase [Pseudomonadales bacterium]